MGEAVEMVSEVIREIQPARGYAVVRPHAQPERTKGGILLPKTRMGGENPASDIEFTGTIVAMGKGRVTSSGEELESGFSVGEEVFFIPTTERIKFEAKLVDGPTHAETGEPRKEKLYLVDQDFICASIRRE